MPKVTNTTKAQIGLSVFGRDSTKGSKLNPTDIETVTIEAGAEVEVDEKFLATAGAKALIDDGKLEVASGVKSGKGSGKKASKDDDKAEGGS